MESQLAGREAEAVCGILTAADVRNPTVAQIDDVTAQSLQPAPACTELSCMDSSKDATSHSSWPRLARETALGYASSAIGQEQSGLGAGVEPRPYATEASLQVRLDLEIIATSSWVESCT